MATKAQHSLAYAHVPVMLRQLREKAGLTQRELGARLSKPQSWVHNCESLNRRVDVTDFIFWCRGCGVDPRKAFNKLLRAGGWG